MPHRTLSIEELTDYLHLSPGDVERLMREADLPHANRGGRTVFLRSDVDAWASKRILGFSDKRLDIYHAKSVRGTRSIFPHLSLIPDLLQATHIDLALSAKTRASILRDMVALADKTGLVYDARELLASVEEREGLCSTALPGGLALLHSRHHAPYRFEASFIVLGRTIQPIPFGAPDGRPTQLFFLIGCEDDRIHLHTLARLCLMVQKTNIISQLLEAPDATAAYDALVAAEVIVLPSPDEATSGRISV
ncbi:PTS sugar transporter subunit IIA [Opitutus sp. ER46]|uniref:PTS sugar transporter subunit IIA n=1 Tax=Opitutus sp. ER46 TaxID=2161864 RepID=UPI001304E58F|nr:PTS sugar transporter subunit IIA [Opitutus sp. ER46]